MTLVCDIQVKSCDIQVDAGVSFCIWHSAPCVSRYLYEGYRALLYVMQGSFMKFQGSSSAVPAAAAASPLCIRPQTSREALCTGARGNQRSVAFQCVSVLACQRIFCVLRAACFAGRAPHLLSVGPTLYTLHPTPDNRHPTSCAHVLRQRRKSTTFVTRMLQILRIL